jgi:hypothetical protein
VRWVQRGAEAAEQDGNDMRALTLARAGADLSAHARTQTPAVPVLLDLGPEGDPDAAPPSEASPAAASAPEPEKPGNGLNKPAAETTDKPSAEEKPAAAAASAAAPTSQAPGRSLPSTPSRPPSAGDRASVRPAPAAPQARPAGASVSPKPSASTSVAPSPANGSSMASLAGVPISELLASGRAERVSVKRSTLDASVLVVRTAQGAKASLGARQAVLVYTDDEAG